jgi:teichuronic acid biosynthesis glycosyltransferase TuaG
VLKQTYSGWELLIVNDGSSDATAALAEEWQQRDTRIVPVHLSKNGGLPNARNEGIRHARGEYIAFLDSDDLWHADKLQVQMAFHKQHPDIGVSHTDFESFSEQAANRRPFKNMVNLHTPKSGQLFPALCYNNVVGVLTVVVRKDILHRVGFFDTTLWTMEDQDLWIRIAQLREPFGYIPTVLAYYRLSESGITSKTGRYKAAYKKFIGKVGSLAGVNITLMWRAYYRYFGAAYFKKGKHKLARLYFCKSIRLVPFDYFAIPAYIYLVVGFLKEMVSSPNRQTT